MKVIYDIIPISTPITTLSYDEKNGYYVGVSDIENSIKEYMENGNYDHMYIVTKLGDILKEEQTLVSDWIGLRRYGILWNWFF